MIKVGILLPGSTMYPSIGIDFLQGLRSCCNFKQRTDIDLLVFPVGYGLKEKEIYAQVEKWILIDNVDVIVAFIENRFSNILTPLVTAAGKLLILTNAGAHYPQVRGGKSNTLFHSLNDSLYSFCTGRLCAADAGDDKTAILATSYFDGGYQHCHAMSNAFSLAGGEIRFNFVSTFKAAEFTLQSLNQFVENNPVKNLLCLYSGDLARLFYCQVQEIQHKHQLKIFGSPMMFDVTNGDFPDARPIILQARGYTSWVPELKNAANVDFLSHYRIENNKEANLFSMQAWEVMLLVIGYLQLLAEKKTVNEILDNLHDHPLESPRGHLQINKEGVILAPAYLVSASADMAIVIEDVIEDTSELWQEMINQVPESEFSTWQNTYLCI